ncbi:hypothetical protein FRB90_012260 [Tulasnella sp. 427]|nr:hypothetical protein FRB90_012260 [Tulasnella sp. 427]
MPSIHFLPPELLSFIMDIACHSEQPAKTRTNQTSQILGLVSKLWRAVVLGTPSIWTTYYLEKTISVNNTKKALERSGGLPLTLRAVDDSSDFTDINEQLSTLQSRSARWKTVEIAHPNAASVLESGIPSTLPAIHTLVVKATPRSIDLSRLDHHPFPPPSPPQPSVSLAWNARRYSTLRHLELGKVKLKSSEVEDFLDFLEACSDLHSLKLHGIWERGQYNAARSVTLPSLQELELRGIPSSSVLAWIVAPRLRRLVLEKVAQLRYWAPVEIGSNFASATDVTLLRFSTLPSALRNIVSAVPLVSDLALISFDFRSPYALSADIILQDQTLPCLKSLHIQGVFSLYQLTKTVKFHQSTLEKVKVHYFDLGLSEESLAREYVERDDALKWLREESSVVFDVDHCGNIFGSRYWSHEDRRWRREMTCHVPQDRL